MPINFTFLSDPAVSRTEPFLALAFILYEGTLMMEKVTMGQPDTAALQCDYEL